jgi:hypothetical protein
MTRSKVVERVTARPQRCSTIEGRRPKTEAGRRPTLSLLGDRR